MTMSVSVKFDNQETAQAFVEEMSRQMDALRLKLAEAERELNIVRGSLGTPNATAVEMVRKVGELYLAESALEAKLAAVREAIQPLCRDHYADDPEDITCFDHYLVAKSGQGNLTPEWRDTLASGSELCDICKVKLAIADAVKE